MSSTDPCIQVGNSLDSRPIFDSYITSVENQLGAGGASLDPATLLSLNQGINARIACLQSRSTNQAQIPTTIGTLQNDIIQMTSAMEADREALEISKARATYIDEARRPVSYYESWFPVGRPLTPLTQLLLIAFTTFMAILGGFLLFSTVGINVTAQRTPMTNPILLWLSRFGYPFWIVLVILIVFFALYLNK